MAFVSRGAALSAISGSIIAMAVAAAGATAFHYSHYAPDVPASPHLVVRLESLHDGYPQVYATISISHADGPVGLGGAIPYTIPTYQTHGDLLVYEGLLDTTRPVSSGDVLHVVVYHPSGRHVMEVIVR